MFTGKTIQYTARPIFYRPSAIISRKMAQAFMPGENFEVRQTSATEDWHPDVSNGNEIPGDIYFGIRNMKLAKCLGFQ